MEADIDNASEKQLRDALKTAISTLEYIRENDAGAAYHSAKTALKIIDDSLRPAIQSPWRE